MKRAQAVIPVNVDVYKRQKLGCILCLKVMVICYYTGDCV